MDSTIFGSQYAPPTTFYHASCHLFAFVSSILIFSAHTHTHTLTQLLLLQAAKDVANALSDLIGSTRAAAGKSVQDAAMEQLKSSAKVSNLLKTVKNVEDEAAKGVRSLENTVEAISSDLQVSSGSSIASPSCPLPPSSCPLPPLPSTTHSHSITCTSVGI